MLPIIFGRRRTAAAADPDGRQLVHRSCGAADALPGRVAESPDGLAAATMNAASAASRGRAAAQLARPADACLTERVAPDAAVGHGRHVSHVTVLVVHSLACAIGGFVALSDGKDSVYVLVCGLLTKIIRSRLYGLYNILWTWLDRIDRHLRHFTWWKVEMTTAAGGG